MFLSDKPLRDFLELNNMTSTVPKDVWQAGLQEDNTIPIIESIVFHDWVKSIQQQSIKQERFSQEEEAFDFIEAARQVR